jgi:hypothetical protein
MGFGGSKGSEEWKGSDWARRYFEGQEGKPNLTDAMVGKVMPYLDSGMPVYGGQRVAGPSDLQQQGFGGLSNWVLNNPLGGGFGSQFNSTMDGSLMQQAQFNPYEGDSPFLRNMISQSNQGITDAYSRGTAAQTDAAANMQGAFGGSGHQEQIKSNQSALADALAKNTTGMLEGQWQRSADLREGALGRGFNAYEGERNRQMGMAGLVPQMYGAGVQGISSLLDAGNIQRMIGQQGLDSDMQRFYEQAGAPLSGVQSMMSLLAQLSGQGGSVTSSVPGASPWGALGGMGLLGASMMGQ